MTDTNTNTNQPEPVTVLDLRSVYLQRWYYVVDPEAGRVSYFLYREHAPGLIIGDPVKHAEFIRSIEAGLVFTTLADACARVAQARHRWILRSPPSSTYALWQCMGCGALRVGRYVHTINEAEALLPTYGCHWRMNRWPG